MTLLKAYRQKELSPSQLKRACSPESFDFESTDSLQPIEGIVGQERALKALKLGVDMKSQGYNIFVTGLSGTGKFTTIKNMLETIRPGRPKLNDYAYVHNFDDEDHPALLTFSAGQAIKFRKELESKIKFLQEHIPATFESELFSEKRKMLVNHYGKQQQELMSGFETKLRKNGFTLGRVEVSGVARPEIFYVVDDEPVMVGQLNELLQEKKLTKKKLDKVLEQYTDFQEELQVVFTKTLQATQAFQEKLNSLEEDSVKDLVNLTFTELVKKYKSKNVRKYLKKLSGFILENLELFKIDKPKHEGKEISVDDIVDFHVNVILDNTNVKDCPVIIETSPTYSNIFGTIEKYNDGSGGWYADFTRIKSGSLLKANGGYLVLNAMDAYSEPGVWKTLKRVLLYGKLEIQDVANFYQFSPSVLKPEPIEINTKIILIGNNYTYSMLSAYEDDFNKIFKVKAEFDYEMKRSDKALLEYARLIKKLVQNEKLLAFDKSAIGRIVEYGARYAGEQDKLTTRFAYIADLVRESDFWARDVGDKIVTQFHVIKAFDAAKERHSLYESKVAENIENEVLLIDTSGSRVGQINGLAVYGNGNYAFGKPSRITATVSLGTGNIVNVEREAGLSGSSHNKGMLILSGYFKEKFGMRIPLSFNANIVFEQGYGKIDGDSASITEVAALVSALSQIPIKQSFAITGSINQKGDIQPIGGVNEKVEGFFDICKKRGLTKNQGVIIPVQNVKDLMLKDEVVEAVINKEFHIYAVDTVEKALELLTGVRAGKLTTSCKYQANTIYGELEKHLREMRKRIKPSPAVPPKKEEEKSKTSKTRKK